MEKFFGNVIDIIAIGRFRHVVNVPCLSSSDIVGGEFSSLDDGGEDYLNVFGFGIEELDNVAAFEFRFGGGGGAVVLYCAFSFSSFWWLGTLLVGFGAACGIVIQLLLLLLLLLVCLRRGMDESCCCYGRSSSRGDDGDGGLAPFDSACGEKNGANVQEEESKLGHCHDGGNVVVGSKESYEW